MHSRLFHYTIALRDIICTRYLPACHGECTAGHPKNRRASGQYLHYWRDGWRAPADFGWGVGAIGDSEAEEHVAEQTSEVTRSQSVEEPVTDNDVNAQSSSSQKLLNSIQDNVHSCVVYAYSCIVYCCIVYNALCISACVLRVSFYHSVNCFNLITHDIIKTIHCPVKD